MWDIEKRCVIGIPQPDENGLKMPDKPISY
jgi:hypothetical protein